MWHFWASKTLQKRLSNASVTLLQRSISGLHIFLNVFVHRWGFHGQWVMCCGALLARLRVCLATAVSRVRPLTPALPP
jgi:hypothetical protein